MASKKKVDLSSEFLSFFEKELGSEKLTEYLFEEEASKAEKSKRKSTARKAARTRAINKEKELRIGKFKVPGNSELYQKIEAAARMKGQSVRHFMSIKQNENAVLLLARDGGVTMIRESEYLISDIRKLPKKAKVYWNGREVSKLYAISLITEIASLAVQYSNVVVINWEVRFDLLGNLHISHVPDRDDIDEVLDDLGDYDEEDWPDFFSAWLDQFENLNYIRS